MRSLAEQERLHYLVRCRSLNGHTYTC